MTGTPAAVAESRLELGVESTNLRVSAVFFAPHRPLCLFTLAHGAGAGMRHPFMEAIARRLAAAGVATFRFQFPYMEQRRRRPDPAHLLEATVRSAVTKARSAWPELPLFAGGKSMGGRMTSQAHARAPLTDVRGLVFLGFPLHPVGKPGVRRAEHLDRIESPMLFLQGDRDALARLDLMRAVCGRLGARATLHVVDGADHSFAVLKRSGRTGEHVLYELAKSVADWTAIQAGVEPSGEP